MTAPQHPCIFLLINHMVPSTTYSAWEHKAVRTQIVVSSHCAFERHSNKHEKSTTRPECHCDAAHLPIWQQGGVVSVVHGHETLLPIAIHHKGTSLQATDPLLCTHAQPRLYAITSLTHLARTLRILPKFSRSTLSEALPAQQWDTPASLRHTV